MYPQGTCNGMQDMATARITVVPMSQPFPNGAPGTGPKAKRSAGTDPNPRSESSLPREPQQRVSVPRCFPALGTCASSRHNKANIFLSCFKPLASKWVV
jgi:hypothetical protein